MLRERSGYDLIVSECMPVGCKGQNAWVALAHFTSVEMDEKKKL